METKVIHKPKVGRVEFEDRRFYTDGLRQVPSVTTVINDVLTKGPGYDMWLKQVGANAEDVRGRAAKEGSRIHNAAETMLAGIDVSWLKGKYTRTEWTKIKRFEDFFRKVQPKVLACEKYMMGERAGGTADLVLDIEGTIACVDIKTGGLYDSAYIQLAAYADLAEKTKLIAKPLDSIAVLHLDARTSLAKVDHTKRVYQGPGWQLKFADTEKWTQVWRGLLDVWYLLNPVPKSKNYIFEDTASLADLITNNKEKSNGKPSN